MKRVSKMPRDRSRDTPMGSAPVLAWWEGHYDHVFIALHPFTSDEAGDRAAGRPVSELDVKTAPRIPWIEVARAVGEPRFDAFALATLLAGYGMTSAHRPEGMMPVPDDALIGEITQHVEAAQLVYPWDDTVSPAIEETVGEIYDALGVETLSAWNEFRDIEESLPVSALLAPREDWPLYPMTSPHAYRDPGCQMLVAASFDHVWSLIAVTDAARRKVDPGDLLEGFFADARTTASWVNEPGTYEPPDWRAAAA